MFNASGIVKPKRLEFEKDVEGKNYGKFSVGPFERGYGVTTGSSLRRMLLSSIEGAAIVSVQIEGVFHEFSSMPGVVEDITEIILNLKEVNLFLADEVQEKRIFIKKEKKGKERKERIKQKEREERKENLRRLFFLFTRELYF